MESERGVEMIFQHTWEKVLSGEKTVTSRLPKEGETALVVDTEMRGAAKIPVERVVPFDQVQKWDEVQTVYTASGRVKWRVGGIYAVQPSRNQKGVARIRILKMWREDVRYAKFGTLMDEGFSTPSALLEIWFKINDTPMSELYEAGDPRTLEFVQQMNARPKDRYDSWRLKFELVL